MRGSRGKGTGERRHKVSLGEWLRVGRRAGVFESVFVCEGVGCV